MQQVPQEDDARFFHQFINPIASDDCHLALPIILLNNGELPQFEIRSKHMTAKESVELAIDCVHSVLLSLTEKRRELEDKEEKPGNNTE